MIDHIVLPSGHKVYFNAEDRKIIESRKWYLARRKSKEYAQTDSRDPLGRIFMHQLLIKTEKGHVIDHMDGNGLNNCRSNLRQCTQAQNCQNSQKKRKHKAFKGVFLDARRGTYYAQVAVNKKVFTSSGYETEIEAAIAYNSLARIHHKDFALLNRV